VGREPFREEVVRPRLDLFSYSYLKLGRFAG
jgi:hypothetical protein